MRMSSRLAASLLPIACLLAPLAADAQRLPANVRPDHYALALTPDLASASFTGTETIDVTLAAPATTVTLNSIELKIQSASAAGQTAVISYDEPKEQATLTFAQPLPAGKSTLSLAFTGILNSKLRGFYLSKTKLRNYAVTQFEATDARRAFPSFDEPALKASFDVALTIDAPDTAISNGNLVSDKPAGPGKHTLVFARTPKMSTYLVAFLVGDFACSQGKSDGVPIRVCATPDQVKLTKFALKAAEHFLTYYDGYFGIKYPMPKLDLIAIPDFEAGAMENFGAITYRETDLLVDEKDGSTNGKKRVASVVAHEMAHQWFGDMVTMQWWNNLWLNEGFATWMQDKAANDWHPEWNFPQDVALGLNGTLNYDAGRTTRTIRAEADTPAQISEMFDGIAYGKAGAVIGMIENYVTPAVFQQGVHNYLAAHLYGNATAEDFWNAQTAASHLPVDRVMSSFVVKPGVPLLTFAAPAPAKSPVQTDGKAAASFPVTQSRFFLAGAPSADPAANAGAAEPAPPAVASASGWTVPVCVKTIAAPLCTLLTPENPALALPAGTALPFFYANAADKGYYRVAYTPEQLKAITAGAETALSVTERVGFLGDRWALIRAGQGSVGDFLDTALALKNDPNASVLDSVLGPLAQIRARIATEDDRKQLEALLRSQFGPVYTALGKPSKNAAFDQEQRRTALFGTLGDARDPQVLAQARSIADDVLAGKKTDSPDIDDAALGISAGKGDAAFYDRVLAVSQKPSEPSLQTSALFTLTRFHDPALIVRTLEYAASGKVRNQDSWILFSIELGQTETRAVAWPWIQQHWDIVQPQLTTASGANLVGSTGSFCTVAERAQVQSFFTTHKVTAADRALTKALDNIDECVKLRNAQEPNLHQWLAAHMAK